MTSGAEELTTKRIRYVDAGTSGGVWGLEQGYCMIIAGETDVVEHLDPIFATLTPGAGKIPPRPPGPTPRPRAAGREQLDGTADWVTALRAERRRSLRQDGAQWH